MRTITLDALDFGVFAIRAVRGALVEQKYLSPWEDRCIRENLQALGAKQIGIMYADIVYPRDSSNHKQGYGDEEAREQWMEFKQALREEWDKRKMEMGS